MNGNISTEGIKLDLDWMHRVGVGGVTIFEGAINTPQVVPQRLIYMTPEWKQAFSDAVTTARSMGMEVAIASSPGWSETGGPWVPAAQGMKKMVWSATRVEGGQAVHREAAASAAGGRNVSELRGAWAARAGWQDCHPPEFYADAAVIAYRIPDGDKTQERTESTGDRERRNGRICLRFQMAMWTRLRSICRRASREKKGGCSSTMGSPQRDSGGNAGQP